jgi:hypothetical protein
MIDVPNIEQKRLTENIENIERKMLPLKEEKKESFVDVLFTCITILIFLSFFCICCLNTTYEKRKKQSQRILIKMQICKTLVLRCLDCIMLLLLIGPSKWTLKVKGKVKLKSPRSKKKKHLRNQKKKRWKSSRELRRRESTATTTTKKCSRSQSKQTILQGQSHWLLSSFNIVACVILLHGCAVVQAVFAPADLNALKAGWIECKSEKGGTGDCVVFAAKDDGSGTGTTNGRIRDWDVSRVTSMNSCECLGFVYVFVFLWNGKGKRFLFSYLFIYESYI